MSDSTFSPSDVRFGIVAALPKEQAAMRAMLDDVSEYVAESGRCYLLGTLPAKGGGPHCVALRLGNVGTNAAAVATALLVEDFRQVEAVLMVGIAGGVPNHLKPDRHVRLGDVVVSGEGGVVAYNFGKAFKDRFEPKHAPRPPSAALNDACLRLQAAGYSSDSGWLTNLSRATDLPHSARPSSRTDRLVDTLNPTVRVRHPRDLERRKGEPRVFRATIACADNVLKDPVRRDQLRDQFGVMAVEMEGSGVAEATWSQDVGYLIVRGICDYCDTEKGDKWQGYAAVIAAAYARAILAEVPADRSQRVRPATRKVVSDERLRTVADALLSVGAPPSLTETMTGSSAHARAALAELGRISRPVATGPQNQRSAIMPGLADQLELHHLVVAPPGSGKTHALWTAGRTLLKEANAFPLYFSARHNNSWSSVLESLSTTIGTDPSEILSHPKVCVLMDGWSEFGSRTDGAERRKAALALHRTRLIANGRPGVDTTSTFLCWTLEPLPIPAVRTAVRTGLNGVPEPSPSILEFLRLPLALSIYLLLGERATSTGELLARFHEHLSRGFPQGFRDVIAGAVADVELSEAGRSRQRFLESLNSRARAAAVSAPAELLASLGTLDVSGSLVVPIHDLYWSWLAGVGLIVEDRVSEAAREGWAGESLRLALEGGSVASDSDIIQSALVDIRLAGRLSAHRTTGASGRRAVREEVAARLADERASAKSRGAIGALASGDQSLIKSGLEGLSAAHSRGIYDPELDSALNVDDLFAGRDIVASWLGGEGTDQILGLVAMHGDERWAPWLQQMAVAGRLTWRKAVATAAACSGRLPPWTTEHLGDLIQNEPWRLRAAADRGVNLDLAMWVGANYSNFTSGTGGGWVDLNRVLLSCGDDNVFERLLGQFDRLDRKHREYLSFAISERGDPWLGRFQKIAFKDGQGEECHRLLEKVSTEIDDETAREWLKNGPEVLGWRVLIARYGRAILPELIAQLPASFDGIHVIPVLKAMRFLPPAPDNGADEILSRMRGRLQPQAMQDVLEALATSEHSGLPSIVGRLSRDYRFLPSYHFFLFLRLFEAWQRRTGLTVNVRQAEGDSSFVEWLMLRRLPELVDDPFLSSGMPSISRFAVPILLRHIGAHPSLRDVVLAAGWVPEFRADLVDRLFDTGHAESILTVFAECLGSFPEDVLLRLLDSPKVEFSILLWRLSIQSTPTHERLHRTLIERIRDRPFNLWEYRHLAGVLQSHSHEGLAIIARRMLDPGADRDLCLIRELERANGRGMVDESGKWLA